jgi:hypothetical protein
MCELMLLLIGMNVRVAADYAWEFVEPKMRAALLASFGFDRRALGQYVFLSEVISVAQAVPGVEYVEVDVLHAVRQNATPAELGDLSQNLHPPPPTSIPAALAFFDQDVYDVKAGDTLTSVAAAHGMTVDALLALNPNPQLQPDGTLVEPQELLLFRGIRPAQLAILSPDIPDTLLLKEIPA